MMNFIIGNTTYRIFFRHIHTGGAVGADSTTATIKEWAAVPPTDGVNRIEVEATVKRHYKDKHNKEAARKEALKKALATKGEAFRTAAWEAYLNRREPIAQQSS